MVRLYDCDGNIMDVEDGLRYSRKQGYICKHCGETVDECICGQKEEIYD